MKKNKNFKNFVKNAKKYYEQFDSNILNNVFFKIKTNNKLEKGEYIIVVDYSIKITDCTYNRQFVNIFIDSYKNGKYIGTINKNDLNRYFKSSFWSKYYRLKESSNINKIYLYPKKSKYTYIVLKDKYKLDDMINVKSLKILKK